MTVTLVPLNKETATILKTQNKLIFREGALFLCKNILCLLPLLRNPTFKANSQVFLFASLQFKGILVQTFFSGDIDEGKRKRRKILQNRIYKNHSKKT